MDRAAVVEVEVGFGAVLMKVKQRRVWVGTFLPLLLCSLDDTCLLYTKIK